MVNQHAQIRALTRGLGQGKGRGKISIGNELKDMTPLLCNHNQASHALTYWNIVSQFLIYEMSNTSGLEITYSRYDIVGLKQFASANSVIISDEKSHVTSYAKFHI